MSINCSKIVLISKHNSTNVDNQLHPITLNYLDNCFEAVIWFSYTIATIAS
jgi:hypothetical protein